MADPRYAQFASSDPAGPDAAFWNQKVYFDGVPRRRREIVPTLAATPGMTEKAAHLLLATAPVADGEPAAKLPAAWFLTTVGGIEEDDEDDLDDEDDDLDVEDDYDEDDIDDDGPCNAVPVIGT